VCARASKIHSTRGRANVNLRAEMRHLEKFEKDSGINRAESEEITLLKVQIRSVASLQNRLSLVLLNCFLKFTSPSIQKFQK